MLDHPGIGIGRHAAGRPIITSALALLVLWLATVPVAAQDIRYTTVGSNVRTGPGLEHPVAAVLGTGTTVEVVGQNADATWLQLRSGNWIFAELVTAVPGSLPIQSGDAPAPAVPGTLPEPDFEALRRFHLQAINDLRTPLGLSALRLAAAGEAQEHADELVAGGYASHWDRAGLTPYMRHSRAGHHGVSSENLFYAQYTRPPGVCGTAEVDGQSWTSEALKGLIKSPGHLATLLMHNATTVRIGLARTCNRLALVQVVGHELIVWTRTPRLDDNRVLHLEGRIDPSIRLGSDAYVVVAFEALPQPIPVHVLDQSRCYALPRRVAIVVRKAPRDTKAKLSAARCPDPWRASSLGAEGWRESYELPVHQARTWKAGVTSFTIALDLRDTISRYGEGVYTVSVWGTSHKQLTELGRHALVVGGPPGHGW